MFTVFKKHAPTEHKMQAEELQQKSPHEQYWLHSDGSLQLLNAHFTTDHFSRQSSTNLSTANRSFFLLRIETFAELTIPQSGIEPTKLSKSIQQFLPFYFLRKIGFRNKGYSSCAHGLNFCFRPEILHHLELPLPCLVILKPDIVRHLLQP